MVMWKNIFMGLGVLLTLPLMAQNSEKREMGFIVCYQPNWYGRAALENSWQGRVIFPIGKHWSFGGGTLIEYANYEEIENVDIPFRGLEASRTDWGLTLDVQYLLGETEGLSHSLHLQLSAKRSSVGFCGEDKRAERTEESTEGGSSTYYSYSLVPEHDSWGGWFSSALRLSYVYDHRCIHFEIGVGYDLTKLIKKKYLENQTTLTSSWDDFNQYYPSVTINPFKDYECGRNLSKTNGVHLFIGVGLDLTKIRL